MARERVLACAVRLLDRGFFRVGGEDYAEENESYGLATMRKEHVTVAGGGAITFDYPAKSGKRRVQSLVDPDVLDVVRARSSAAAAGATSCSPTRRAAAGATSSLRDINEYVKEVTGGDFSAKDFRTWNATVLAAVALAVSGQAQQTKTGRKRAIARAVKEVARYLGNTPAVCRASYIDPRVFDRFQGGLTIGGVLPSFVDEVEADNASLQGAVEEAVIDLIAEDVRSPALEKVA